MDKLGVYTGSYRKGGRLLWVKGEGRDKRPLRREL